jgi:LPS-assembly lipoprotein
LSRVPEALLLCCLLALTGCGFTPLYAGQAGADVQQQMDEVAVGIIPDRTGQMLRDSLEAQLQVAGAPVQQRYLLSVSYNILTEQIGLQQDTSATRNRFIATASWTLSPIGSPQQPLVKGQATTENAQNIIDEQYFAQELGANTINQQLADEIASQISSQIAAYFKIHRSAS